MPSVKRASSCFCSKARRRGVVFVIVAFLFIATILPFFQLRFHHVGKYERWDDSGPPLVEMKKCIAIGMFTRSDEYDLRQWQRREFRAYGNFHSFNWAVNIRLRFIIAPTLHDNETMTSLLKESERYHDLIIWDFHDLEECIFLNRCLTGNHHRFFYGIRHLCDDASYEGSYFVTVECDSVLNYENMARVFMSLPNQSVLFGRLLPNLPDQNKIEGVISNSSGPWRPMWNLGSFHGFSKDLLLGLLKPENLATIVREDFHYLFPETDKSTGIEVAKAPIPAQHFVFLKGVYVICPSESFSCATNWNNLAFHSGLGYPGKGADKIANRLQMMERIQREQAKCHLPVEAFYAEDHYFFVEKDFIENANISYWIHYGCATMNEIGVPTLATINRNHKQVEDILKSNNIACTATLYKKQLEEFRRHSFVTAPRNTTLGSTEGSVAHFSSAFVEAISRELPSLSDNYRDLWNLRLRFIREEYRSNSFHYFCPEKCDGKGFDISQCPAVLCDYEVEYLRKYPDVAVVVKEGHVNSASEHYAVHGSREGRIWSCLSNYEDEASGTKEGCYDALSKFVAKSSSRMHDWPIWGRKDYDGDPKACKALVIIDGRDHPWMEFVLKNHRRYLGPYWKFYLIGPKGVARLWKKKYEGPMVAVVETPVEFGDLSNYPDDYNRLLLSRFLWEKTIHCENVLVTQTDAILFRHGVEDFFKYDYVGAPIYSESFPTRDWRIMNAYSSIKVGGNGGLSFRKRSAMIDALDKCPIPILGSPEDAWSSACMLLLEKELPHPVIANRFSIGTKCNIDVPFGGHKLWLNCKQSTCELALVQSRFHRDLYGEENSRFFCPEGEMLYLFLYPDVREALQNGAMSSGWEHYERHGRHEVPHRIWRCLYSKRTQQATFTKSDCVSKHQCHK